jgi:pimeloyl-ACP methyl ester carboxylesterase
MEFLGSVPDDGKVILVGHSYGGLSISLAMEKFPEKISAGVFVTSYMPKCTDPPALQIHEYFKRSSAVSSMDCKFTFDQGLQNPPSSVLFGPDYISTHLYKHCPKEDAELAKFLIRRSRTYFDEMTKDSLLTKTNNGSINRVYVICEEDDIVQEDFQKFVIENNPPLEVMSIARAGHMVMISQPAKLSLFLQQIATKYTC